MTLDLDSLLHQVRLNCHISDAHHAGVFSVCGLALRLRDLYRWERGLDPWQEAEPSELLQWIGRREAQWDELAEADYGALPLAGKTVDPFDTEAVNAVLAGHGLHYGAGLAQGLKPTFFLAAVEDRQDIQGCRVYGLGRELARDLLSLPALGQADSVLLRRETARRHLWDQIAYAAPSGRRALDIALKACGVPDRRSSSLRHHLNSVLPVQETLHLRHELGEILEKHFSRERWREIIGAFPLTRVELVTRRVKDTLADTGPHGPLRFLCRTRHLAGLALYQAFSDRLAKSLFPGLSRGLEALLDNGDWAAVEEAVEACYDAACEHADTLMAAHFEGMLRNDPGQVEHAVEQHFGELLGRGP
jgi:hypothetical protein